MKTQGKVRLYLSISLIALGVIIAAGLILSFAIYKFKSVSGAKEVERIAESYAEIKSSEKDIDTLTDNAADASDDNTDYHESYSVGKMQVDADRLYKDSIAYNEELKSTQSDYLISEDSYTYSAINLNDYGITNGIYAYISAPAISMTLPIYLGANDGNMAYGAAHLCYTSLPTGGESTNTVLSAHSGYAGKWLFDDLPSLYIGDEVIIKNYFGNVVYTVTDTFTREPSDSQDIYIKQGKGLLTLITCISDGNGGFDRYVVVCEYKGE